MAQQVKLLLGAPAPHIGVLVRFSPSLQIQLPVHASGKQWMMAPVFRPLPST